jgi:hypothetical protein
VIAVGSWRHAVTSSQPALSIAETVLFYRPGGEAATPLLGALAPHILGIAATSGLLRERTARRMGGAYAQTRSASSFCRDPLNPDVDVETSQQLVSLMVRRELLRCARVDTAGAEPTAVALWLN